MSVNVKNRNIVVIGDSIEDVFIEATKMGDSAEAVPTYRELSRKVYSGGAANVAKHCLQLGAKVMLIDNSPAMKFTHDDGFVDSSGWNTLPYNWYPQHFGHEPIHSNHIVKTRLIVDGVKTMKLNEIDDDSVDYAFANSPNFDNMFTAMFDAETGYLPEDFSPDIVIAADNRHGMFSAASARSLVKTCQERSLRLLVDSQMSQSEPDWSVWDGCHSLFLNDNELVAWERGIGKRPAMLHHKMGVNGSDVFSERRDYCPGFPVNVVDTLGAGDAYLAAWAVTEDIRAANAWAALSCTKPGTELPRIEDLTELLESNNIQNS